MENIHGNISVAMGRTERYRHIYSNSSFFITGEYYVLKDNGELLTITRCGLDIPKKAQMFTKGNGKTDGFFQFVSELPVGKFEFEYDESTCDEVKIYYN